MYFGLLTIPAGTLVPGHRRADHSAGGRHGGAGGAVPAEWRLINAWNGTVWDTSWLLREDSIPGRLLHTLVGYVQAPDGAQIAAYIVTIAGILLLMRMTGRPQAARRPQPAE